jgi:hypothetical protein
MRTWTLTDGTTFDAELSDAVSFDDNIKFNAEDGRELRIPPDRLSPEDREYISITRVPPLKIDFLKSLQQILFSSKVALSASGVRDPVIHARFGVRVKQLTTADYKHELSAEFFAIGRQVEADRYLVLAREYVPFHLTKENERTFEYESDNVTVIENFYLVNFRQVTYARRGHKYHGYIILIRDELGRIVAHEESVNWLFDHVDNLLKLRVGNYLDKECKRRYPVRPEPVVQLDF